MLASVTFLLLAALSLKAAADNVHSIPQSITDGIMTYKEHEAYVDFLEVLLANDQAAEAYSQSFTGHSFFDMFKVAAKCTAHIWQYPPHLENGKGAKHGCRLDMLKNPCVIYSFGSGNNFYFEAELKRFSECQIHIFDCYTNEVGAPSGVDYHKWCVDDHDIPEKNRYTITSIMQKLGHSKIDFLKLSIEGSETFVIPQLAHLLAESRPLQIAVKLNAWPDMLNDRRSANKVRETVELALALDRMGYRLLSRDDQIAEPCCSELVFGLPDNLPGGQATFPYGYINTPRHAH